MSKTRWAIKYPSGALADRLFETREAAKDWLRSLEGGEGHFVPVTITELPATPPDHIGDANEMIWPPKWGEGLVCGWCRRKSDGVTCAWSWATDGCMAVATQLGKAGFYRSDEFAQQFEPI